MQPTSGEMLEEAIREYQAALDCPTRDARLERFQRAELLFAGVIEAASNRDGRSTPAGCSPELLVNAGNAALGAEHLGPAVLAYRRALSLDPDHRRARQNLHHARSLLPDWVPRPEEGGWLDTFFAWNTRMSSAERRSLAALMFVAAAGLFAASLRWRRAAVTESGDSARAGLDPAAGLRDSGRLSRPSHGGGGDRCGGRRARRGLDQRPGAGANRCPAARRWTRWSGVKTGLASDWRTGARRGFPLPRSNSLLSGRV